MVYIDSVLLAFIVKYRTILASEICNRTYFSFPFDDLDKTFNLLTSQYP